LYVPFTISEWGVKYAATLFYFLVLFDKKRSKRCGMKGGEKGFTEVNIYLGSLVDVD
jgi:hypothetical protein